MHPVMEQLKALPVSERLTIVQELWDSIDDSRDVLSLNDWQRELGRARLAELNGCEDESGLSRDDVWGQADKQRGS